VPVRRANSMHCGSNTVITTSTGELSMARKIPLTCWSSHQRLVSTWIMWKTKGIQCWKLYTAHGKLLSISCQLHQMLQNRLIGRHIYSPNTTLKFQITTKHYFSFGPAINTLMPLPAFTLLKASSASSNLTVPVINFFTSTTPRLTKSTARL
jgi:hypothetical protein